MHPSGQVASITALVIASALSSILVPATAEADAEYIGNITYNFVTSGGQLNGTTSTPATYMIGSGGTFGQSVTSSADGGMVSASSNSYNGTSIDANAEIQYTITLVGPSGPAVGVFVAANGFATGSGTYIGDPLYSASASFDLTSPYDDITPIFGKVQAAGSPVSFAVNTEAFLMPNEAYTVNLTAMAGSSSYDVGYYLSSSSSASVDPTFTLDPAFASKYTLTGVPVASAVPEPEEAALLTVGILVLTLGFASAKSRRILRVQRPRQTVAAW